MKAAICGGVKPASGAPELAPVRGPRSRAVVGGGVNELLVALENSRSSTTAEPALGMLLLADCPSIAGSDSPPPLQASKPALAIKAMSGALMYVLLHEWVKGGANLRFGAWVQGTNSLIS